jgi:hypothetical protein
VGVGSYCRRGAVFLDATAFPLQGIKNETHGSLGHWLLSPKALRRNNWPIEYEPNKAAPWPNNMPARPPMACASCAVRLSSNESPRLAATESVAPAFKTRGHNPFCGKGPQARPRQRVSSKARPARLKISIQSMCTAKLSNAKCSRRSNT